MSKRIAVMAMLIAGVTWLCAGSAAVAGIAPDRCEGTPGLPDPAVVAGNVIDTAQIGLGEAAADAATFGAPIRSAVGTGLRPAAAAVDVAAGPATNAGPITKVCAELGAKKSAATGHVAGIPAVPRVPAAGSDLQAELPISGTARQIEGTPASITVLERLPEGISKLPLE